MLDLIQNLHRTFQLKLICKIFLKEKEQQKINSSHLKEIQKQYRILLQIFICLFYFARYSHLMDQILTSLTMFG